MGIHNMRKARFFLAILVGTGVLILDGCGKWRPITGNYAIGIARQSTLVLGSNGAYTYCYTPTQCEGGTYRIERVDGEDWDFIHFDGELIGKHEGPTGSVGYDGVPCPCIAFNGPDSPRFKKISN
jgi:hypothetical protein